MDLQGWGEWSALIWLKIRGGRGGWSFERGTEPPVSNPITGLDTA